MQKNYDIIGAGIGPFHLSLAALLRKVGDVRSLFLDQKPEFFWHQELMFQDATMQTSYLKDLVTPVDPTSPYSFINYLVKHGLFYSFMNLGRPAVTRREFELYCQWVSQELGDQLGFNQQIEEVRFNGKSFEIRTQRETFTSKHISMATGLAPRIPEFAKSFLGQDVFHAKSPQLQKIDLTGKKVVIVGGGQTGLEIFRNAIKGKWGRVKGISLISRRQNLEPLDDSPFTNEYFAPGYVDEFYQLDQERKDPIVKRQKLASDGNTPDYLKGLYHDLYQMKFVERDGLDFRILPHRSLVDIERSSGGLRAIMFNGFLGVRETLEADVIILSTGFNISTPAFLDPLKDLIHLDQEKRLIVNRHFDIQWDGPETNKIFALNFSRHRHGISEPQTSLMAWRSADIINNMLEKPFYQNHNSVPGFIHYGKI